MASSSALSLDQGWEYRWGDSPFNERNQPLWTLTDDPEAWSPIGFPSNPPDRRGQRNAWFRITLPEGNWTDPVLYIYSVDLITQVYLEDRLIYQYGQFREDGSGDFRGWPWHQIPLPEGFAGQQLHFRIYSNYSDIGLWGEVKIMDQPELILFILENSVKALISGGISILVALLAFVFAWFPGSRRSFGAIGLFALGSGLMIIAESQARLLLMNTPLTWNYLGAAGYYSLPLAMALLLEQWFGGKTALWIRRIWQIHLMYLVGALALSAVGVVNLSSTFPVFDVLLLITLSLMFALLGPKLRDLSLDERSMVVAFAIFGVFLVVDMLVAHNFLPWTRVPVSWGALAFSLVVVTLSLRHYGHTQIRLTRMNRELEEKVQERTQALENLADKERDRARILSYENEKNRILADIVSQLEKCNRLDEGFGVLARSLPGYAEPLAGSLYLRLPQTGYFRLWASWRQNPNRPLPDLPNDLDTLPAPSTTDTGALLSPHNVEFVTGPHWCFHITLEHLQYGQIPCGALLLALPETLQGDDRHSNQNLLFLAVKQSVERISIVLSSLALREQLQTLSYEDALTGLKNRRYFDELLAHELAVAARSRVPLAIVIADIDHFKAFNDRHGHPAGDTALKAVAQAFMDEFRETDTLSRYGGEEFVMILPGATAEQASERAEALRHCVEGLALQHDDKPLRPLTLSLGVASWPVQTARAQDLLARADKALYLAKQRGRNRIECLPGDEPVTAPD
ncbi:MAG: sensor domain-containing diguanylate cyclase [Saccharospirillum sp.]